MVQGAFSLRQAQQIGRDQQLGRMYAVLVVFFVLVFALLWGHPFWQEAWSWQQVGSASLMMGGYLLLKWLLMIGLGRLFKQYYFIEELVLQTYLFDLVAGLFLFPLLICSIYAPWQASISIFLALGLYVFFLLLRWGRLLYVGFFERSFSPIHIIMYLCALEILPLIVIIKYFLI